MLLPAPAWVLHRLLAFRTCPPIRAWALRGPQVPQDMSNCCMWSSSEAARETLLRCQEHLLPFLLSACCSHCCFSQFFKNFKVFCPFWNTLFGAQPCPAVGLLELAGTYLNNLKNFHQFKVFSHKFMRNLCQAMWSASDFCPAAALPTSPVLCHHLHLIDGTSVLQSLRLMIKFPCLGHLILKEGVWFELWRLKKGKYFSCLAMAERSFLSTSGLNNLSWATES